MISIIIPVYNTEKYLVKCLRSITEQSFCDFEAILVNDGSTDNSLQICTQFANEDSRFKVISQVNKGLSETRNIALRMASGRYITGIDSDDWVEPNYLEVLYTNIVKYMADIAVGEFFYESVGVISRNKYTDGSLTVLSGKEALSALLMNKHIRDHFCGKLYKKELFDGIEFLVDTYFEDIQIMFRLFAKAKKVVKINTPAYCYVEHAEAITAFNSNSEKKFTDWNDALMQQYTFLKENPDKFANIENVRAAMARNFHHLKHEAIKRVPFFSPAFRNIQKVVNKGLRISLSDSSIRRIGILRYVNYMIILHFPIIIFLLRRLRGR